MAIVCVWSSPALAAEISVDPAQGAPGDVVTISGLPPLTDVVLQLEPAPPDGTAIPAATDEEGEVAFGVPDLPPREYELEALWFEGEDDVQQSARTPFEIVAPSATTSTTSTTTAAAPPTSTSVPPTTVAVEEDPSGPEEAERLGFMLVGDPRLSFAIDVGLLLLGLLVLAGSARVRAIVVDTLRRPRTRSWIDEAGKLSRERSEDGAVKR